MYQPSLCVSRCAKHFTCIISFNHHTGSVWRDYISLIL